MIYIDLGELCYPATPLVSFFQSVIFLKGNVYTFKALRSLLKRGLVKKDVEFAPHGSEVFPFRVDLILKGAWCRKANRKS